MVVNEDGLRGANCMSSVTQRIQPREASRQRCMSCEFEFVI